MGTLYHLTAIENLSSMFEHGGILPKNALHSRSVEIEDISMADVQARRSTRRLQTSETQWRVVHDLVPLFLRTLTPMLYKHRPRQSQLCFIEVDAYSLMDQAVEFIICDGNIAASATNSHYTFGTNGAHLSQLPWETLDAPDWHSIPKISVNEGRRRRAAEVLVHPRVPIAAFQRIVTQNRTSANQAQSILSIMKSNVQSSCDTRLFF